jgi:restriction endonuclease S subunit
MREGWVELSLGELTENTRPICYGVLKPGPQVEGGVPLVKITDMDRRILGPEGMQQISNELDNEFRRSRLQGGEVLLSIQGTVGRVAIAASTLEGANISRTIAVIDPDDRLHNFYLMYVLEKIATEGDYDSAGSTRESLNISTIRSMKILCPPIPEQKRIVDLISSVDSYIEALQQQLERAKRSRNAVLHEFLTAGGDDWVETTLGEVTQINPEQAKDFDSERLIKYVDLSTVTFDNGIDSEIDPIPFNEAPGRARRIVRENDVIVATVRPYLKGFAFVNKDFNEQIASTGFCVIRAESELILPELVWALIGSDDFVDFLVGRSTGSSYPAVRPIDISEFRFILPPFKDQETVAQLIRTFDQLIKDSTNLINSTQNLRSGLLSDLLSGAHEIPASYDKIMGAAS